MTHATVTVVNSAEEMAGKSMWPQLSNLSVLVIGAFYYQCFSPYYQDKTLIQCLLGFNLDWTITAILLIKTYYYLTDWTFQSHKYKIVIMKRRILILLTFILLFISSLSFAQGEDIRRPNTKALSKETMAQIANKPLLFMIQKSYIKTTSDIKANNKPEEYERVVNFTQTLNEIWPDLWQIPLSEWQYSDSEGLSHYIYTNYHRDASNVLWKHSRQFWLNDNKIVGVSWQEESKGRIISLTYVINPYK